MDIFSYIINLIRDKKGYFIFLLFISVVAIVLGVFAGINVSGGILVVDLSNIAYIQFLTNNCSFVPMIFKLMLSMLIFAMLIHICHIKTFLLPLALTFYMYLVYSQTVVFVSIILLYGFFNCIVLSLLLFIYIIVNIFIFTLICLELNKFCNQNNYFNLTFNIKNSYILIYLIAILIITIIFCSILAIFKSFIILLVY